MSSNTVSLLVAVALGLIGIVVTVIVAVRYAERKKPTYDGATYLKIAKSADAPEDIQIAFKGAPVHQVTSTFIWFWNAGRRPIKSEDIPATQPLVLQIKDEAARATILDFAIRKVSRPAINFQVAKLDDARLRLTFDFLDFHDGAVVEVQHVGGPLSIPEITGVVLGAPAGMRRRLRSLSKSDRRKLLAKSSLPSLAEQYQERARPNRRRQALLTAVWTGGIGGLAFLLWKLSGTTTALLSRQEIQGVLHTYLAGPPLDSAVQALIVAGSRSNDRLIWILLGTGSWLLAMLVIWWRGHAFPDSLLLGEVEKENRREGDA